ncbi:MAG TPA: redox-sensing transcriptional repressor Rex [Candidatus Ozemobacteraceae bacterium]
MAMVTAKAGPKLQSVQRLPAYLGILRGMLAEGREFVSTSHLADVLKLPAIVIRKDLQMTGITGTPRVGFDLRFLVAAIEQFLGWNNTKDVFLVGVRGFGEALLTFDGFRTAGMDVVAGFDRQPELFPEGVRGKPVFPIARLGDLARRMHISIAILTVPDADAQETAELLATAGIRAIWDFTTPRLCLPDEIIVQKAGLISELAVLSKRLRERGLTATAEEGHSV